MTVRLLSQKYPGLRKQSVSDFKHGDINNSVFLLQKSIESASL